MNKAPVILEILFNGAKFKVFPPPFMVKFPVIVVQLANASTSPWVVKVTFPVGHEDGAWYLKAIISVCDKALPNKYKLSILMLFAFFEVITFPEASVPVPTEITLLNLFIGWLTVVFAENFIVPSWYMHILLTPSTILKTMATWTQVFCGATGVNTFVKLLPLFAIPTSK